MRRYFSRAASAAVLVAALSAGLLASCSGPTDDAEVGRTAGRMALATPTRPSGGTLRLGVAAPVAGFDPVLHRDADAATLTAMAAVYDTLLHWDPVNGRSLPGTALFVNGNDDATEWTVQLRPGLRFADGTPYDAEAVKWALNRQRAGLADAPPCTELVACPGPTADAAGGLALVQRLVVIDPVTLRVTLREPWTGLAHLLAGVVGMIPSPTALRAACPDPALPVARCGFDRAPVGAGPFVAEPLGGSGDGTVRLVRNPAYGNGPVALDAVELRPLGGDRGAAATLRAVTSGAVDAAVLRDPVTVASPDAAALSGFTVTRQLGAALVFATAGAPDCASTSPPGCTAKAAPLAARSAKVRQAVAAALDAKALDARANDGAGRPGTELLTRDVSWSPGVGGPRPDPEAARRLVAEARLDGWDATLRLAAGTSRAESAMASAVVAQLAAAGISAQVVASPGHPVLPPATTAPPATVAPTTTARPATTSSAVGASTTTTAATTTSLEPLPSSTPFDVALVSLDLAGDDGLAAALSDVLASTGARNLGGYRSRTMDGLLRDLVAARTDDARRTAAKRVADLVASDLPLVPLAAADERLVWRAAAHDLSFGPGSLVYLDRAWLG